MDVSATRAPLSVPFVLLAVFVLLLVSAGPATASGPYGRVRGFVTDSVSGFPVVGASVQIQATDLPWEFTGSADGSGYFQFAVPAHRYTLSVSSPAHLLRVTVIAVGSGQTVWYNLSLNPNPVNSWINGTVYDQITSSPIAGANITARVDGLLYLPSVSSNATGRYSMRVPSGTVEVAADAIGYAPNSASVYVWSGGGQYALDFALTPFSKTVRGYLTDGVTHAPLGGVPLTVAPLFFTRY